MRKNLSLWVLGITAMLASCSQDDALQNTSGEGITNMTVTASLSGGINTRATNLTDTELESIKKCKLLVYNQSTKTSEIENVDVSGGTFTFNLKLASNAKYDFYCWADDGESYTVADDGSVTMKSEKPAMAQRAEKKGVTPTDKGSVDLTLSNAVAKLVLGTTGNITKPADISVTAKTYTSYDLKAGTVSGTDEDIEVSAPAFTTSTASADTPAEVLSFYVLVGNDSPNQQVTVTYGKNETPVTNVPLKPDYRTLLKGDLSLMNKSVTITAQMDKDWNDEEKPITATAENGVIETTRAGQIVANPELITQAITTDGKLTVKGPMNTEDLNTIASWIKDNSTTDVDLDLGNTTGLTEIPESCFKGCANLKAIVLPETLQGGTQNYTPIGFEAFSETGITSITVPSSICYPNNFRNMYSLKEIHLMGNIIGCSSGFLSYCGSLTDIYFHNTTAAPWIGNAAAFAGITKSNVTVHLPANADLTVWQNTYYESYWKDFKYELDIVTE